MRRHFSRFCAGLIALTALPIATGLATNAIPAQAAAGSPSAFTALPTPVRLADTRSTGAFGVGITLPVAVTSVAGDARLPAAGSITAAVLNVTVVGPAQVGYWTIFPHGGTVPTASNINVDPVATFSGNDLALPNLVTVPVTANGLVDVYSSNGGNVIVDMLGYYAPAAAATAGRFIPLTAPSRMTDTRTTNTPLAAGETRDFTAPGAAGSSAVALNVTVIGNAPGYWQVFPTGTTPPSSSNLNTMVGGQATANQVIVPVDASGTFSVFASSGGQVIIDVVGTFTGSTAPSSTVGLFVPLDTPTRFLDTRTANLDPLGASKRLLSGWDVEVPVTSNPAINRTDVSAVVMNLTVTDTFGAGYVSVTPAGSNDPAANARSTSNINISHIAQTLANHAIVPVSTRGFDVFTQTPLHAIADISGFYLGTPSAPAFGLANNVDPTPAGCLSFTSEVVQSAQQGNVSGNIAIAQQRLIDLGFWLGGADGTYGLTTQQSVMAYQKWNGLSPSGKIDTATAQRLSFPNCRPTTKYTGDLLEVDKGKQLAIFISGGKVQYTINTSTGGGYFYEAVDENNGNRITGTAITPDGTFHIYRVADQAAYHGSLGTLYRPRFIVGGVAMHGYPSVPNYPASHGCVRVTNAWMDQVWAQNLLPIGKTVIIHD
ncbi:MAG: hypothetical protein JWM34_4155 [Ilumatobacteraceae bacterium]|nr:hypothetical protein [Ilumatobacteraceae bacterium]